jgi:AraC-like DNA-binding protein
MIYFMINILIPLTRVHSENRKILSIVFASIVIAIIFASFWLIDLLLSCNFIKDIRVLFSIYIILLFIISGRYPELMIVVKTEIERERYIKTQLKGVNVKLVISRLDSFMEDKRIFAEQITLPEIAGLLDIRPHQLSEILNLYLNTTFFNYINYHRIKEAKHLLLNRPEMTIGEITYESGYNSSSSFYREFKKNTGVSPLEFRNKKESLQLSAV